MKQLVKLSMASTLVVAVAAVLCSATPAAGVNIRYVNFKECVETSEMGKVEQSQFDAMKKQMEVSLEGKEKEINALAEKLNDVDYLDSLSPEAETDLKRKFRALNQEIGSVQQQYMQTLQQANFQVIKKMQDAVATASNSVAKAEGIDLIVNEDVCFHKNSTLDITNSVVAEMNKSYKKETK
jgi:outer membrane protein